MAYTDPTDFLGQLNEVLGKFGAKHVNDITDEYTYFPDFVGSRLGAGSYGEAFRMRSASNPQEPLRVVKAIPKARVSKNALQIQHLAAELAVTGFFKHKNLNKRVGLFHNSASIFLVLELVSGSIPDAKTRLLYLFAHAHPRRLADFDEFYAQLEADASANGFQSVDEYLDRTSRMRTILAECGAKREVPASTDLFGLIVAMKRVPDGLSRIIMRESLDGLQHLHENNVVHRDIKTENCVLGLERNAQVVYNEDGSIRGTRISEKVSCKLIDFGLVKYMRLEGATIVGNTLSPGMYDPNRPAPGTGLEVAAANQDLDFDDDDDDDKPSDAPAPTAEGGAKAFPVMVTPCGTELYCSLEVITGILKSGVGRTKWLSDSMDLPKMDVYGVGTMLFCCANGRPPFRPPKDPYRKVISREERIKQVQKLVTAGPLFSANVADNTKDFVQWLMTNDPAKRPLAFEALRHPYLATAPTNNTYVYEISVDGRVTVLETDDAETASAVTQPTPGETEADDDDYEDGHEDVLAAAVRGKEDKGDSAGKEAADGDAPATRDDTAAPEPDQA